MNEIDWKTIDWKTIPKQFLSIGAQLRLGMAAKEFSRVDNDPGAAESEYDNALEDLRAAAHFYAEYFR